MEEPRKGLRLCVSSTVRPLTDPNSPLTHNLSYIMQPTHPILTVPFAERKIKMKAAQADARREIDEYKQQRETKLRAVQPEVRSTKAVHIIARLTEAIGYHTATTRGAASTEIHPDKGRTRITIHLHSLIACCSFVYFLLRFSLMYRPRLWRSVCARLLPKQSARLDS